MKIWLGILLAAAVFTVVVRFTVRFIVHRYQQHAFRTMSLWGKLFVQLMRQTRWWVLFIEVVNIVVRFLDVLPRVQPPLTRFAVFAVLYQGAIWMHHGLPVIMSAQFWGREERDQSLQPAFTALTFVLRVMLWCGFVILALDNLGVNVTALVAGFGIGGIAIALAVQNILGDLLASLSIAIDRPFVVGDEILIDTFQGRVEHVGLKTTRLRSVSGEQLLVPNSDMLKGRLRNYERMSERRSVQLLHLPLTTPIEVVRALSEKIATALHEVKGVQLVRAYFKKITEAHLIYEVVYTVQEPNYQQFVNCREQVNLALFGVLQASRGPSASATVPAAITQNTPSIADRN